MSSQVRARFGTIVAPGYAAPPTTIHRDDDDDDTIALQPITAPATRAAAETHANASPASSSRFGRHNCRMSPMVQRLGLATVLLVLLATLWLREAILLGRHANGEPSITIHSRSPPAAVSPSLAVETSSSHPTKDIGGAASDLSHPPSTLPASPGSCACSSFCLEYACGDLGGVVAGDRSNATAMTVVFSRCSSCRRLANGACGVIARDDEDHCSAIQLAHARKVLTCASSLAGTGGLPRRFSVQRDALSRMLVVCTVDRPLSDCLGTHSRSPAVRELNRLRRVIDDLHPHVAGGGGDLPAEKPAVPSATAIVFLDVGAIDPLMDVRMASSPDVAVSAQPFPRGAVGGEVDEAASEVRLNVCLNRIDASTLSVARLEEPKLVVSPATIGRRRDVILRLRPRDDTDSVEPLKSFLVPVMSHSGDKPSFVTLSGPPRHVKALGVWLLSLGYTGLLPSTCLVIEDQDSLQQAVGRLPSAASATGGSSTADADIDDGASSGDNAAPIWVANLDRDAALLHASCPTACARSSCVDGWRQEYLPCERGDVCLPHHRGKGCAWNMTEMSGGHDVCPVVPRVAWAANASLRDMVLRCLSPDLPVARFAIVPQVGLLLACRGDTTCHGVDEQAFHSDVALLTDLISAVKAGLEARIRSGEEQRSGSVKEEDVIEGVVHVVFVGPFVGAVPLALQRRVGSPSLPTAENATRSGDDATRAVGEPRLDGHPGSSSGARKSTAAVRPPSAVALKLHLFEANPFTRQWLHVTKCLSDLQAQADATAERKTDVDAGEDAPRFAEAILHDVGVGVRDERCNMPITAASLLGDISGMSCPEVRQPHPDLRSSYLVTRFQTLDSIYGHWSAAETHAGGTDAAAAQGITPGRHQGFILFFDGSVDSVGEIVKHGELWLRPGRWQPKAVVLGRGASLATALVVAKALSPHGYKSSSVALEGVIAPLSPRFGGQGRDGYVFVLPR